MAELKKVARGKGFDGIETNHDCDKISTTDQSVESVRIYVAPITYHGASITTHEIEEGADCKNHTPTIKAACQTVFVGVPGVGLRPIAREDDKTEVGGTETPDIVKPVYQSTVWVGI